MKNAIEKFTEELARKGFKSEMNVYGSNEIITLQGERIPACFRTCCTVSFVTYSEPELYRKNSTERETEFLNLLKRKKSIAPYRAESIYRGTMYIITTPEDAEALKEDARLKHFKLEEFWQARHKALSAAQVTA